MEEKEAWPVELAGDGLVLLARAHLFTENSSDLVTHEMRGPLALSGRLSSSQFRVGRTRGQSVLSTFGHWESISMRLPAGMLRGVRGLGRAVCPLEVRVGTHTTT